MAIRFQGTISSQVTPFDEDGRVDEERLCRLIDRQLDAGVHGFLIAGNCGEFTNLTDEERVQTVEVAVGHIAGRVPVMAGDFHPNTDQAIALARYYRKAGADAALVVPPYFIRPDLEGVVEYFRSVAEQSGLPVVVYNNPARTGMDLSPAVMRRLYGVPGLIALKDCTRDLAQMAQKVQEAPSGFAILYGDDDMFVESLMMGAEGGILAAANLVPDAVVEMYREATAGDPRKAAEMQNRLLPMIRSWYTANHPAPLKEAMDLMGQPAGRARKPLRAPGDEQREEIRRTLAELGLAG
jgi:4-hydroxy-tetrahydrodipicolinate synthase